MSNKLNHHFVPQYFFRQFNGERRYIHLFTLKQAQVIPFAPIRGQCARHKFYGTTEIEDWFSDLEGHHARVLSKLRRYAWDASAPALTQAEIIVLLQAILFQRARTPRACAVLSSGTDDMLLYAYRQNIVTSPSSDRRKCILEAIQAGKARIRDSSLSTVLLSTLIGLRAAIAIGDLHLAVLRNHSVVPFIFADAPVVFYNLYMWEIKGFGVLGFQSPGLLIVLPLDTKTQLLLFDSAVYECPMSQRHTVELIEESDVAQLNALQVHAAQENIYFVDESSSEYTERLCAAHRSLRQDAHSEFLVHQPNSDILSESARHGELMHIYEPQLPLRVDFSFLRVAVMPPNENINRPRNTALAQQMEQLFFCLSETAPLSAEAIASLVEIEP